jgi:hypothetical protein
MNIKNILLLIFIVSISIYPQLNREEALKQGGWSGGMAGWIGWENFTTDINLENGSDKAKVDGYNFIFSSRNGSIVETNGVFGFDFQWREKHRTTKPDPNPENLSEISKDKVWFVGLWARYYIPFGGNLAMFFEGSGGYAVFDQETFYDGPGEAAPQITESFANGFAYNAGIGFSHFVSANAAFEITGRWEGGSLNGNTQINDDSSRDLNVKLGNIFILFGFQIYLR